MKMNLFLQNEERRINLQNVHKNNSNGKQTRIYGIKGLQRCTYRKGISVQYLSLRWSYVHITRRKGLQ